MAPKRNDDVLVTSLPRATIKDRLRMTHKPQTLTCLEKWPIVCGRSVCGKMCRIFTFTSIFTAFLLTFNCTNHHRHISAAVLLPWTQASCLRKMACARREFEIPPSLCFCTVSQEAININSKSKGHVHCPCEVCSGEPVYPTTAWRHIQ